MRWNLLLVLVILATSTSADYGWRPRQEYRFQVEGRTLAGVPSLKHQYAGLHFTGRLQVQAHSPEILMMKLQNMTFTKVHTELPKGWWQPLPEPTAFEVFPVSKLPFIARLEKGKVIRLVVSSKLASWEVNFVQSVVAHLQLDFFPRDTSRSNKALERHQENPQVYTVMEDSVVGRCEVLYDVAPLPKSQVMGVHSEWSSICGKSRQYLEITKTWNYSRCEHIAESHFGLPSTLDCSPGGNQCGAFWTRTSLSRSIGCGERKDLILLSTVSSSRVVAALRMQPEDTARDLPGSDATVSTYLNLTLISVNPYGSRRFGQPTDPVSIDGLRFQYETAGGSSSTNSSREEDALSGDNKTKFSDEDEDERDERDDRDDDAPQHNHRNHRVRRSRHSKKHKTSTEQSSKASDEKSDPREDMNQPPLLPFSYFSLAHREGEARACLVQQLKEIITDVASDMEQTKPSPDKMTLEKFQIAVKICRTMTAPELFRAVASIMEGGESKSILTERKLVRDLVVMCGTNPSFLVVKEWLEERKIQGEEAAEMIAAVPSYLITPSSNLVHDFYQLVRTLASSDEQQLRISSVVAFSHLLRVACTSKTERKARFSEKFSRCHQDKLHQYLPYLTGQMKSEPTLRRVYITALGNTAAPAAMQVLLSLARDSNATPYQRASAILATRYYVFKEPASSVNTLLSFYTNPSYPTAVRIAALSLLFYTRPSLMVWQRVAISTWYENNPAINAYIWSTLNNLAAIEDPFYYYLRQSAIAVIPLARAVTLGPHLPYNWMNSAVTGGLHEVVLEQLSWSADLAATNLYYRQTQRLGGFSSLQFETDLWLADADGFMTSFADMLSNHTANSEDVRPPIRDVPRSTRWIHETLKLVTRDLPRTEGHATIRLGALHERILPFDHKIINAIEKARRHMGDQLRSSKPILYQKMGETGFWLGVTSELGLPIQLRINVPWSLRAKVDINGPKVASTLAADLSFSFTSQLTSELSVYTPFDCMRYVAGSQSQTFIQLPHMRVSSKWGPKKQLQLSVSGFPDESLLLSQTSRPYTAQHDVINLAPISLAKTTHTLNVATLARRELLPGMPLSLDYRSEAPIHRWSPDPRWVLNYPALWPGLEVASLQLTASDMKPFNLVISLNSARAQDGNMTTLRSYNMPTLTTEAPPVKTTSQPSVNSRDESDEDDSQPENSNVMEKMFNTNLTILSSSVEDPTGNFNASTLKLLQTQHRPKYLLEKVLSGMNSGQAYVLSISLSTNNSSSPRYQTFWTVGAGRARRYHRAGFFMIDEVDKTQTGVTATLQYPEVPLLRLRSILQANLTSHLFVDFKYLSNDTEALVSIRGAMSSTETQTKFVRNSPVTLDCLKNGLDVQPECRKMALEAGYLDRYNLTVSYNQQAENVVNSAHLYVSALKYALFQYLAEVEIAVMDAGDKIKLVAEISPDTHTAAVWVRSPKAETELTGMPISPLLMNALRLNPIGGFMPVFKDPSFCSLEGDRVVTFDGARFSYLLGDCWHVLAKDCSGRSRIVVLARYIGNHTEIEVNIDNYKIVRLLPGKKALVNGRHMDLGSDQLAESYDKAGTRLLELSSSSDDTLQLHLPAHGLTVLHTQDTILIKASSVLRGRVCGMCGDFDGELEDDLRGPSGHVIHSPYHFATSYALPSNSCHVPH